MTSERRRRENQAARSSSRSRATRWTTARASAPSSSSRAARSPASGATTPRARAPGRRYPSTPRSASAATPAWRSARRGPWTAAIPSSSTATSAPLLTTASTPARPGRCPGSGSYMEVEEIAAEVEKDLPFFRTSGGGVTLSGGEPTLFMDYASELLRALKEMGVHTIVETCGHFDLERVRGEDAPLPGCRLLRPQAARPGGAQRTAASPTR